MFMHCNARAKAGGYTYQIRNSGVLVLVAHRERTGRPHPTVMDQASFFYGAEGKLRLRDTNLIMSR